MTNKEISSIFNETYNLFWMKWRDNVPLRGSVEWDILQSEAHIIKLRHGTRLVRKWEGPVPTMEEESVAAPIVNWFMDELEAREREKKATEISSLYLQPVRTGDKRGSCVYQDKAANGASHTLWMHAGRA